MTTSFGGDQQPGPSIDDAGYGLGELPVEPTIIDRLGGRVDVVTTVGAASANGGDTGIDDPGSWRPTEWTATAEHRVEPGLPAQQAQPQPLPVPQPQQPPHQSQPLPVLDHPSQPLPVLDHPNQFIPALDHPSQQPLPALGQQPVQPNQQVYPSQQAYQGQWLPPVEETGAGFAGQYPPVEFADSLPYYPSEDFGDEASRVRPYAWTGGRTRSSVELQLETLVSTSELGQDEAALTQVEYRAVGTLCRHPHSVAEVAAKLSVPLGVAKVILSDMAELGLISIHRTFADDDIAAHLVLMERVLSGLRRL